MIFHADGHIDITAKVVRILGLFPGDSIDIMDSDGEYYLYVAHRGADKTGGSYEAVCYKSNKLRGGRHLRAQSRRLCNAVLEICGHDKRAALPVGYAIEQDGRVFVPLITRLNLNKQQLC